MPIYVYRHPEKEEYREVFQGMNDEHVIQRMALSGIECFYPPTLPLIAPLIHLINNNLWTPPITKKAHSEM